MVEGTSDIKIELELLKYIGSGSYAKVFHTYEKTTDVEVASKIFMWENATHKERVDLAEHEYG